MNTHPNRILNVWIYNEFVNLCAANCKAALVNANAEQHKLWFRRFVLINRFMSKYHFYLSGSDVAGDQFHFAYWG